MRLIVITGVPTARQSARSADIAFLYENDNSMEETET